MCFSSFSKYLSYILALDIIDLRTFCSVLAFTAFFVTICYHTIYASPWIFPPLAFYGVDVLLRLFRYRIKDATLVAVDKQMTIVRFSSPFAEMSAHISVSDHVRFVLPTVMMDG
jgi:hypothetical protein